MNIVFDSAWNTCANKFRLPHLLFIAALWTTDRAVSQVAFSPVPPITPVRTDSIAVVTQSSADVRTDEPLALTASRDEVRVAAGAYSDIPRFLQTLPGVTFDSDTRNTFMVNGGNPLENLFVVDGVEIPNINHISSANSSGGFVSMIDTDAVSSIKLHNMLYGAQYSGALSSVLEINTRRPDQSGRHGDASVGYAGAASSSISRSPTAASSLPRYARALSTISPVILGSTAFRVTSARSRAARSPWVRTMCSPACCSRVRTRSTSGRICSIFRIPASSTRTTPARASRLPPPGLTSSATNK